MPGLCSCRLFSVDSTYLHDRLTWCFAHLTKDFNVGLPKMSAAVRTRYDVFAGVQDLRENWKARRYVGEP